MKKKHGRKRAGFTLIELMTALAILVLLTGILYAVFNAALRGWKKSDNILQATQIARTALERMSREIASARIVRGSAQFFCLGFANPSGWRADSVAAEFYFIAPLNHGHAQGSDLCEVGYWLRDDGDLMRFFVVDDRSGPLPRDFDFDFQTGNSNQLAGNITALVFEFFDADGARRFDWDSRVLNEAPARIRIRITVEVGEGTPATNPDYYTGNFSIMVSLPPIIE